MKIKIVTGTTGMKFPYGLFPIEGNRQFIIDFVGAVFPAEQHNMNYYKLNNGMLVHVYNAREIKE